MKNTAYKSALDGKEPQQKDIEKEQALASEHADWLSQPYTQRFLLELKETERKILETAVNQAESLSDQRLINKTLHHAAALRKVIEYGQNGKY